MKAEQTTKSALGRNMDAEVTPLVLTVKLTQKQTEMLLREFSAKRDEGTLRWTLAEKALVADAETMAHIAYRIENSAVIAESVSGHGARAKMLRNVLRRIAKAGVVSKVQMKGAGGEVRQAGEVRVVHVAPESRLDVAPIKKLHPSTRRRIERVTEILHEQGSDGLWDAGLVDWEKLRRGRAQGRELGKRAWNAKIEKRAPKAAGMVRGDKMFRRGLPDALPIGKLNDDKVEWLRAGTERDDKRRSRETSQDATFRIAREGTAEKIDKRITRMIAVVENKHGRVRPSWVGDELVREDVRARRYQSGSGKAAYMRKRYTEAARKRIDPDAPKPVAPIETLSARAQRAAARQTKKRVVRFAAHEHSWRVTPKRTKRTCETCGTVERKQRGRWVAVVRKAVLTEQESDRPKPTTDPEPYAMKARTSRNAKRNGRRWSA